ncbi:hypothetical protein [Mycobacterium sp. URHB0021]
MTASTTDSTSHIAAVLVNAVVDDGYHVTATHWNYAAISSRRSTVFAKLGVRSTSDLAALRR